MRSQPSSLRINREERRFLGVCAGLADYFDIPVLLVRIVCVISFLTWPTLIIGYFVLYFVLDRQLDPDRISDAIRGSGPMEHFKNLDYRRPIFRDIRNKKIAGVCSGVAQYLEVNICLVRVLAIISIFILGPYALLAYAIGWIVLEPNPAPRFNTPHHGGRRSRAHSRTRRRGRKHRFAASRLSTSEDEDLYDSGDGSDDPLYDPAPKPRARNKASATNDKAGPRVNLDDGAIEKCADMFYSLETRMRELEAYITSKKFRLHCEINRI